MKPMRGIKFLPQDAVYDEMDSPVGKLIIITAKEGLHAVLWENDRKNTAVEKVIQALPKSSTDKIILKTKKQLTEYFQGNRKIFDLPLVIDGTDFQKQCWQQLIEIPYAQTISYGEQAQKIGGKNKARAVGMSNGLNPISIIIPCHRVVGKNKRLVGFASGLENKRYLLNLEGALNEIF